MTTIPSRRFDAFSRLYQRYLLDPGPVQNGQGPGVLTTVIPVTQLDELLAVPLVVTATLALEPAAGTYVVGLTVPDGKRWKMRLVTLNNTAATTRIQMRDVSANQRVSLDVNGTTLHVVDGVQYLLDEKDTVGALTTGNAGDTAIIMSAYVEESDAF